MSKKHYYDMDLARAIVILILPITHIMEYLGYEMNCADILTVRAADALAVPVHFLTLFGAPVFMILMGFNMVFSKRQSPADYARRGLALLVIEFLLNLIRYGIPGVIACRMAGPGSDQVAIHDLTIYGLCNSDILAFAGLFFLVYALFRLLKLKPWAIMVVTIVASIVCEILANTVSAVITDHVSFNMYNLLGNFIWLGEDSTFPLLEWMIFPAIGTMFGLCLKNRKQEKENKIFAIFILVSVVVLAGCILYLYGTGQDIFVSIHGPLNDSHMTPVCTLAELAISFIFIGLMHFIYYALHVDKHNVIRGFINNISYNITGFYSLQWIVIGWIMFLTGGAHWWGRESIGLPVAILDTVLVTVFSYLAAPAATKVIHKIQNFSLRSASKQ